MTHDFLFGYFCGTTTYFIFDLLHQIWRAYNDVKRDREAGK